MKTLLLLLTLLLSNISAFAQTIVLTPKSTFVNNSNESMFLLNRKTLEFLVIQTKNAKDLDSLLKVQSFQYGLIVSKLELDKLQLKDSLNLTTEKLELCNTRKEFWFTGFMIETTAVVITIIALFALQGF